MVTRWARKKKESADAEVFGSVVDGLKKIYASKIKPVEQQYLFDAFHSPLLRDSDFEAKPQVLLLGQYSTGKTSFIRFLLERDFPGAHIGPEPTTDRFMAIMWGKEDLVTPGNALAVQADMPFTALSKFGIDFLNKFQGSQCPASILEDLTFIDTPGVLSGEKQRIGRSYDFVSVCEWFAARADLILLLFDAHKLDISDEFKRTIEALKGQEDKVRVVLNKADGVSPQQLMRVYGALMWSLGKVLQTPEVMRVYIGSFWEQPYKNTENATLFEAERADLLRDLFLLPKNSATRKINELVKRARLAKVHAFIIAHLKAEMPSVFGKDSKQKELIENLKNEFQAVARKYQLPLGDFPNLANFQERLKVQDFNKFPKLNMKLIEAMDQVLADDIPKLMRQFPQTETKNPFSTENPFAHVDLISQEDRQKYNKLFVSLNPIGGKLTGAQVKDTMMRSGLPNDVLSKVWVLADADKDGRLNPEEFAAAMYLINDAIAGNPTPDELPAGLIR